VILSTPTKGDGMTIRKGTNRAKAILANARNVRGYSLANNFSGTPLVDKPVVWGGYDSIETWAVYQSVTDTLFRPIFFQELVAQLFAYHYAHLNDLTSLDWNNEEQIASDLLLFIRALYGEEAEESEKYREVLEEVNSKNGENILRDLWLVWRTWLKDTSLKPEFALPVEPED
jgi:hypothetical protein